MNEPRPVEALFNEVRLLYQSLVQVGETIHAGSNISIGMRAVLEYLERQGPTTVPHMARARRVTRQRIQMLVNALLAQALVEPRDNPASRRSPLIGLTTKGAQVIAAMRALEASQLEIDITDQELFDASATLANVRRAIEKIPRDGF